MSLNMREIVTWGNLHDIDKLNISIGSNFCGLRSVSDGWKVFCFENDFPFKHGSK